MPGSVVGKYRVVGELGRGATGIVYRAVDDTLGREVALKALNPAVADPGSAPALPRRSVGPRAG